MLKELEKDFLNLPWYLKLLLVILGVNYISNRKGIFWRSLQGLIIVAGAAILFPLLFLGLMSYKLYLYLSMHMNDEIGMEIAVILFFINAIVIELIIYDFARYRKLKREGKWVPREERKEKKDKKNKWIYVVPIVFGAFVGLCAYVFMKDKKLGERLFQLGMWQTIALMICIFMVAVIFG